MPFWASLHVERRIESLKRDIDASLACTHAMIVLFILCSVFPM